MIQKNTRFRRSEFHKFKALLSSKQHSPSWNWCIPDHNDATLLLFQFKDWSRLEMIFSKVFNFNVEWVVGVLILLFVENMELWRRAIFNKSLNPLWRFRRIDMLCLRIRICWCKWRNAFPLKDEEERPLRRNSNVFRTVKDIGWCLLFVTLDLGVSFPPDRLFKNFNIRALSRSCFALKFSRRSMLNTFFVTRGVGT